MEKEKKKKNISMKFYISPFAAAAFFAFFFAIFHTPKGSYPQQSFDIIPEPQEHT